MLRVSGVLTNSDWPGAVDVAVTNTAGRQEPLCCVVASDTASSARTVDLHRPHSAPAPHTCATSLDVEAPAAITSCTVLLVTA
jgi:hypothetical protein